MLTEAADKYKVVTQMGNQGSSGDGVRQMQEWFDAALLEMYILYIFSPTDLFGSGYSLATAKPLYHRN